MVFLSQYFVLEILVETYGLSDVPVLVDSPNTGILCKVESLILAGKCDLEDTR